MKYRTQPGAWQARRAVVVSPANRYVVAELGITAPRTKSDDQGRFTDGPALMAISSLTELLLHAAATPTTVLVDVAGGVVGSLGIDTAHLTPAI